MTMQLRDYCLSVAAVFVLTHSGIYGMVLLRPAKMVGSRGQNGHEPGAVVPQFGWEVISLSETGSGGIGAENPATVFNTRAG